MSRSRALLSRLGRSDGHPYARAREGDSESVVHRLASAFRLGLARRVRFGPPDRLSPLGEVYLQPTLTTGHWTGEGGSRERGGEKMVWEPDRFNARVAHRLRGRPRFELIKARDLESLATA